MGADLNQKRLFVAIDFPPQVKEKIYKQSFRFLSGDKNIRQLGHTNIHITLKFLGNVENDKLPLLKNALMQAATKPSPFSYTINNRIDAFPNVRKASIIFVGIADGGQFMEEIFKNIEQELVRIKIRKEKKKFIPHATIARIKRKRDIAAIRKDLIIKDLPALMCDKITLFESRLMPAGAQYTVLEEFILGKSFNLG
ncbi:MAG: RNA 2',3'-cyclic phosphodiesterase [Actinomycetota bacterium]